MQVSLYGLPNFFIKMGLRIINLYGGFNENCF